MIRIQNRFTDLKAPQAKKPPKRLYFGAEVEEDFYNAVIELAGRYKVTQSHLVLRGLAALLVEAGMPVPESTERQLLHPSDGRGKRRGKKLAHGD